MWSSARPPLPLHRPVFTPRHLDLGTQMSKAGDLEPGGWPSSLRILKTLEVASKETVVVNVI